MKIRNRVAESRVVADSGARGAPEVDRARGEGKLLGAAEQVAVAPVDTAAAAEIARVRGAHAEGMRFALGERKGARHGALHVGPLAEADNDREKHPDGQQALAPLLDELRIVDLSGVDQ